MKSLDLSYKTTADKNEIRKEYPPWLGEGQLRTWQVSWHFPETACLLGLDSWTWTQKRFGSFHCPDHFQVTLLLGSFEIKERVFVCELPSLFDPINSHAL